MKARERRENRVPWTEEEIAYLKENFATADLEEMAEKLGKTVAGIRHKAGTYGLKRTAKKWFWTEEKLAYLKENYGKLSIEEMAKHFGRTPSTIRWALDKHGIRKKPKKKPEKKTSPPEEKAPRYGNVANIGRNKNPVTVATQTLICSCVLDNMTVKQIATLTERAMEQVREVITEATKSGYMEWIQERREDSLFLKENLATGRSCVRGRG